LSAFDRGLPRPWRIALKNIPMGITLVFDLTDTVMIGREGVEDGIPEIDLNPYDALNFGVSRRHAILRLDENRVYLTDNGSKNGVTLNDELLNPGSPYLVRSGDSISLGQMRFQITFLTNPFSS
jgi:pSer/pThr/pTyr-binding forkhead associated (FHA) protein